MEEKQLDARESLELITRMIRNTRRRLERNSERPFLVWGYTTVAISLLNYALRITGADPNWSLTWFLIPPLGVLLMRLFPARRSTEPRTEIDRIVNALWLACSLSLIPIFILALFHGHSYRPSLFALITLVMSIGTASMGLHRPLKGLHDGRPARHGGNRRTRPLGLHARKARRLAGDGQHDAPQRDSDFRSHLRGDDGHPGPHHRLPEPTRGGRRKIAAAAHRRRRTCRNKPQPDLPRQPPQPQPGTPK